MYFTNICWHDFDKEKPEKEGRYLIFRTGLYSENDNYVRGFEITDRLWANPDEIEKIEKIKDPDSNFDIVSDNNDSHFWNEYFNEEYWEISYIEDDNLLMWAELEPMKEELKSYIFNNGAKESSVEFEKPYCNQSSGRYPWKKGNISDEDLLDIANNTLGESENYISKEEIK